MRFRCSILHGQTSNAPSPQHRFYNVGHNARVVDPARVGVTPARHRSSTETGSGAEGDSGHLLEMEHINHDATGLKPRLAQETNGIQLALLRQNKRS